MLKVLIAEDDPMVRQINERFLEKVEGFTLTTSVSSIKEAKKIIQKTHVDLVLLDLFFPNEKGQELLKWIRTNDFKCDVILITADKSVKTIEEVFRYGAVDYLIKPFTFERFEDALSRFKSRKTELGIKEDIEQDELDKFVLYEVDSEDKTIVDNNAFSKHTYDKVLKYLGENRNESFTSQEVANNLGVSRITARRYLDLLEKEGLVIMDLEYGKIGRPKNKYRIKR